MALRPRPCRPAGGTPKSPRGGRFDSAQGHEVAVVAAGRERRTMTLFTVTIVGNEADDGEAPWLYVVSAPNHDDATARAVYQYILDQDGADYREVECRTGLPESGNYNDLRPGADPVAFFRELAGYSYDPAVETRSQARDRAARELADAEEWAVNAGYSFGWAVDPDDEHTNGHVTYVCVMYADDGEVMASLGGVDLADKGTAHPYARVIQAELAADQKP